MNTEIPRNMVRISNAYFHRYLCGATAWRLVCKTGDGSLSHVTVSCKTENRPLSCIAMCATELAVEWALA